MKSIEYYQGDLLQAPIRRDYVTCYFYCSGQVLTQEQALELAGIESSQFILSEFSPGVLASHLQSKLTKANILFQVVFDEIEYNLAVVNQALERKSRRDEFIHDLFVELDYTNERKEKIVEWVTNKYLSEKSTRTDIPLKILEKGIASLVELLRSLELT